MFFPPFQSRLPAVGRALGWPWPLRKPWQRRELHLCAFGGGIGDELMCAPVFREVKRRNPAGRLIFHARFPELFEGNPNIDAVEAFSSAAGSGAIALKYEPRQPAARPLITQLGECVGVSVHDHRLEAPVVGASADWRTLMASMLRPRVVIQPAASRWTPNKDWPRDLWIETVHALVEHCDVIEVGTAPTFPTEQFGPHYHSLAGRTTIAELAWVVSQAALFLGPVSAGMHLASAYSVPSVIIFGGYEAPEGHRYPRMIALYTSLACAPCWLNTACPYGKQCLHAIRPAAVLAAVDQGLGIGGLAAK